MAFLGIAGSLGFAAYTFLKPRLGLQGGRRGKQPVAPRSLIHKTEYPVEHGDAVRPEELHGHGQLYFVPVGAQAIPVQSLADYYLEKFGTQITVLPQVDIRAADCVPERRQCVAEELEAEMTTAYAEIARNPDSVMIALTDEDIFPRELGWRFTYSLHGVRIGIVSTRRMNPAFWGGQPNDAARLASTKQMLTKYVAMMYYRIPASFDPTSVMYTPLKPNGGSDDLHESDLHPEASANGRRGTPYPCLSFTYSYQKHEIMPVDSALTDCKYGIPVHAEEEAFEVILPSGALLQRSLDAGLDSTPAIEFRRGYSTGYTAPMEFGLGWGVNHSYNAWLSSNGLSQLTYIDINGEASMEDRLERLDSGRGFNASSVYESHSYETYGARMKWESGHYTLRYRDGASSTFYDCDNSRMRCYWNSYQDAKGNTLDFDRGPHRELRQLSARDNQGIRFQYDDRQRMTEARTTDGKTIGYEYDDDGCLAKVVRADGQVTLYSYDSGHRMTSVTVVRKPGAKPEEILVFEYDARGRIVKQTLANIGAYEIEYLAANGALASELRVTDPAGQVLRIAVDDDDYVVRAQSIQFPRVVAHR